MKEQTPRKAIFKRPILYTAAGLLLGCCVLAALIFERDSNRPNDRVQILSLSNLPEGAKGDVRLESAAGKRTFKINSSMPFIMQDSDMPSKPYRLYATILLPGDIYRDFIIAVDRDGQFSAVIDGFDAWDPITLTLDDQPVIQRIPADWSGKLELHAQLQQTVSARACIEVNSAAGTIGICHDAPERRGT